MEINRDSGCSIVTVASWISMGPEELITGAARPVRI
jgi:hypothetical protein